ncbi:TRAP transporter small permease [Psychromarinibacter halotolerans]|uniref:TRAP transporter small permease n=1 Tax=Psychromarinibacter halotolerans TaxID=1775175 RepID=UPI0036D3A767
MPKGRDLALPFRIAAALLLVAIVTLTVLQVVFRFVLGSPLVWSEELARLAVLWMTFVGAIVCCWDGSHLRVSQLPTYLKGWLGRALYGVNGAVIIVFLAILAWTAIPIVEMAHRQNRGALSLPVSYYRSAAPVGAVLMIAYLGLRWWRLCRNRQTRVEVDQ